MREKQNKTAVQRAPPTAPLSFACLSVRLLCSFLRFIFGLIHRHPPQQQHTKGE